MHDKNFVNFQGTDTSIYKYINKEIKYEQFGFEILFEKINEEADERWENLTDDAKIYRSILSYWSNSLDPKKSEFFRSRYILENWLYGTCHIYLEKYSGNAGKTKDDSKVEQDNPRVMFLLDRLTFISILESKRIESKNHEITSEYRFTELGKLVALLLDFKCSDNGPLIDAIYNQVQKYYSSQNYSIAKFYTLFFMNCYNKDKYLFKVIVYNLSCIIRESPSDKNSILFSLRNFPIQYDSPTMFVILVNSINEFKKQHPHDYNKVVYKLKLATELFVERNCKNMHGFEKLRYENDGLHSVILEGYCDNCKYVPFKSPSMFYYFRASIKNQNPLIIMDCPICNIKDGLTLKALPQNSVNL